MQKTLFLSIFLFSLLSCSSNVDNIEKDPIIENWYIADEKHPCSKEYTTTFTENGIYTTQNFEVTPNGSCSSLNTITAKWEKKSDNNYIMTINNEAPEVFVVKFSDNNNTFVVNLGKELTYKRK